MPSYFMTYLLLFLDFLFEMKLTLLIKNRWKIMIKTKALLHIHINEYWDVKNLYDWEMSQNLPVNKFEWIEDTSQFNEDFIKIYNDKSDEWYFFEVDVQYPQKLHYIFCYCFFCLFWCIYFILSLFLMYLFRILLNYSLFPPLLLFILASFVVFVSVSPRFFVSLILIISSSFNAFLIICIIFSIFNFF